MQRRNYFFMIAESKKECDQTDCVNCEHMRAFLMEASEYHECFNEKKKERFLKSVRR